MNAINLSQQLTSIASWPGIEALIYRTMLKHWSRKANN